MPRRIRDNQNYQHHAPTPAEPWWEGVTPVDDVRYARALRLSQFVRDLVRGPTTMMREGRLAYRRQCIERWQAYLDGWAPYDDRKHERQR